VSQRPEWTPDGRRIAYVSFSKPKGSIRWQPWDGRKAEVLIDTTVAELSLGPKGGYLAVRFSGGTGTAGSNIWIAHVDSPNALRPFLTTSAIEKNPRVSPSGRLLAYVTDENGRDEVYVQPLPGGGGRLQVSHAGGQEPVWSADGRELFYRSGDGFVISATIAETPALDVVRKDSLFVDAYMRSNVRANFDVFPNGKEFVFVQTTGGGERSLWGIARWSQGLSLRTQSLINH
jgi:Tol biopolymer transport system component